MPQPYEKLISLHDDTRDKLLAGLQILYDLVSATLGPGGRFICVHRAADWPFTTKDGKTVAEEVFLHDEFQNAAAQMVKEVSIETCRETGDGTTTACVLAYHIFKDGIQAVKAGANPVTLKKGMDAATHQALAFLEKLATPVVGEDIRRVAAISANGDQEMADLISSAVVKAGRTGAVTLDYSHDTETKIQVVDGCQLDTGWVSPQFITDPKLGECVLENPYILLIDKKLQSIDGMWERGSLLEKISDANRSLLLVCENIEGQALATLVYNKTRGALKCAAVRTPAYKEAGRELLEDIAALTGATVIGDEMGLKLSSIGFEHLGQAGTVKISQTQTSILDGIPVPERLQTRIEHIQAAQLREPDQMRVEHLQLRLSRLSGGIVVVRIGGNTPLEVEEKKYRAEDAMHATRAAIEKGIVPGGGVALLRASQSLECTSTQSKDYDQGYVIVRNALEQPIKKIASNAGYDGDQVWGNVVKELGSFGFDALTGTFGDMKENGIVDPVKVVLSALKNAESIATNMLLIEGMICLRVNS